MKLKLFLIVTGWALAAAGVASACESGTCNSGSPSRGSYDRYGGGTSYGCNTCNTGGSNYGYGRGGYGYNANYNNNSNYNNTSNRAYGGSAYQSQGQGQGQSQSMSNSGNSTASANNNSDNRNAVSVSYANIQKQQPVATAYAAPLVAGVDTCMGSTSVGGQGITIGFSAATTWTDRNCVRLKNSRELNAMGMGVVACELLAQDREVAEALRRSGMSCGVVLPQVVEAPPPPPPPPVYTPPPSYPKAGERG